MSWEEKEYPSFKEKKTTSAYVKKEEEYKELHSSAVTFFIVSIAGFIVLLLDRLKVIRIFYGIFPLVIMSGMLIGFLVIGFFTYKKSIVVRGQIKEENETTELITNWLLKNVTYEELENQTDPDESYEEKFYQHTDFIKEKITLQFGELNEAYLERLVEDFYNNHLEE